MTQVASNDTNFFEVFDSSLGMQNGKFEGFFPDLMGNFDSEVYISQVFPTYPSDLESQLSKCRFRVFHITQLEERVF